MPRYLVLDRQTGHVVIDTDEVFYRTRDYWACEFVTPQQSLTLAETEVGNQGGLFVAVSRTDPAAYDVYRADISGPDDLPTIDDGEDPEILTRIALGAADYVTSFQRLA